ncbi:MAG: hypothetical protein KDD55_13260, partial [Bdellovibrionales bacterium]|nr:hypothetical protein [Bdellovibrionales bacterium]
ITENDRRLNMVRTMITSQLRWCHHLYNREQGISLDPFSFLRSESYEEENAELESSDYTNSSYLLDAYHENIPWDSPCEPWATCPTTKRNLNAFEAIMELGSIQQCPFELSFPEIDADLLKAHLRSTPTPKCLKPNRAPTHSAHLSKDLYPDFEGVFFFLHRPNTKLGGAQQRANTNSAHDGVGGSNINQPQLINFTIPLEQKIGNSIIVPIATQLRISKLPAIHSPAMGTLRADFIHNTLADLNGKPFYPVVSGVVPGAQNNPLNFSEDDQTSPLLPFSYTADDTLYVQRPLGALTPDLSPMMIVTHTLPSLNSLRRLLITLNTIPFPPKTPFTISIVHIPTNLQDAVAFKTFQQALDDLDYNHNLLQIHLISLSPFHPHSPTRYTQHSDDTDWAFKMYWKDLLDPEFSGNAIDIAEGLFFSLFAPAKQRF